jgi:hypothetical protein
MKKICILMGLLILSGCTHGARIQYDYIDVRDECREFSEDNAGAYVQQYHNGAAQLSGRDKNAILAKLFADCMYQKGWTVATPSGNKAGGSGGGQQPQPSQPNPAMQQSAPPIRYIPAEPIRPATNMPIPANRQRINP